MKITTEVMVKAHKMTREIKTNYPGIDYHFQLGICISYLLKNGEEEMKLQGSEKQVRWAKEIIKEIKEAITLIKKGMEVENEGYVDDKRKIKDYIKEIKEVVFTSNYAGDYISGFKYLKTDDIVQRIIGRMAMKFEGKYGKEETNKPQRISNYATRKKYVWEEQFEKSVFSDLDIMVEIAREEN